MHLRIHAQLAMIICIATLGCSTGVKDYSADATSPTVLLTTAPTFDPPAGAYTTDQNVVIASATDGASIFYTIDGSAPDPTATAYTDPVVLHGNGNWTLRAVAIASTRKISDIAGASYSIAYAAAAPPVFDPNGGVYGTDQNVTLSSATPGATIYYTTDGTPPTASAAVYAGAIPVTGNGAVVHVQAMATAPGYANSAVASADYNIVYPVAAAPTFSANLLDCNAVRSLSTTTANAHIFYTTDGTEPTGASTAYTAPFAFATGTVKAIAVAPGYQTSAVSQVDFAVTQNIYVSAANGNDATATGSVTAAYATVGNALLQAANGNACFAHVLVQQGNYPIATTLVVDANVALMGGYDSQWGRHSDTNTTRLVDANTPAHLLLDVQAASNSHTVVSGLTLVGQSIAATDSTVLAIEGGNCVVANNNITVQGAGDGTHTAIHVVDGAPQIIANHLHVSQTHSAFGILIDNGSPLVFSNTIDNTGAANLYNYGIAHGGVGVPIISNNTIGFGAASLPTGIGYNNSTSSTPYIENNIIWSTDLSQAPVCIVASSYVTMKNNNLFSCAGGLAVLSSSNTFITDIPTLNGIANASNNLSFDMVTGTNTYFVNETNDWHLQTGLTGNLSMVKNGGLLGGQAEAVYGVNFDLDGHARATSNGWTMGAYELHN